MTLIELYNQAKEQMKQITDEQLAEFVQSHKTRFLEAIEAERSAITMPMFEGEPVDESTQHQNKRFLQLHSASTTDPQCLILFKTLSNPQYAQEAYDALKKGNILDRNAPLFYSQYCVAMGNEEYYKSHKESQLNLIKATVTNLAYSNKIASSDLMRRLNAYYDLFNN